MIRRIFALFLGVAAGTAHAQASDRFLGTADRSELSESGAFVWRGNAVLRDQGALLTAHEIRGNHRTGEATATGNVVFTRGTVRLLADRLTYRRADRSFTAERVRLGSFPYYAEGASATGQGNEIILNDAIATYGEPGRWQPTLRANRVIYSEGRQLSSDNPRLGLGSAQFLPFPKIEQNLGAPFAAFATANGGYRSSLGVFAELGVHIPFALGVRVGGELSGYSQRGVMFGPGARYTSGDSGQTYRGVLNSGYINDHGERGVDILGRPVPENRAFVEWQHQQKFSEQLDLKAQLNWWKDSEVLRDFRPRRFFPVQQPDTFLESNYAGQNFFVSLFARFQPNSFQRVQERLPELRFDLLPSALGGGVYHRMQASYAHLRDRGPATILLAVDPSLGFPPSAGPFAAPAGTSGWDGSVPIDSIPIDRTASGLPAILHGPNTTWHRAQRLDAYYALERPYSPTEWFTFTPIAGGRVTHYAKTQGAQRDGSYTRVLGEFGFDAALRASGTFAYRNDRWKIDGLRHLFTPRVSYRNIPHADKGRQHIPPIDIRAFSTYLQPLGLGDIRNIDDLGPVDALRLSLDNILQTRDGDQGTRDLVALNLATDFRFKRRRGERDVSEIHAELALMPAHWIQLDVYNSFRPQDFVLREFNTGLTLRNAELWSLRFSNNFLRGQLQDYYIDGRARFNEAFALLTRLHYDARRNRFNEQAYGFVQNVGNTWQISYIVSLYSGRVRESRFGFNIEIDALRF